MPRQVKCPVCEDWMDKPDVIDNKIKNRYYCDDCYDEAMDKQKEKEAEKEDYNYLIDYIEEIFGYIPTPRMFAQIKRMKEEHGYSYYEIETTLRYMEDMPHVAFEKDDDTLGLVIYYHRKAMKNNDRVVKALENNRDVELTKIDNPRKVKIHFEDSKYIKD